MTDIVAEIVKSFRKLTPLYMAVSVAAGAVLFMPATLAGRLGIDKLEAAPRAWIGVTFLGALGCLVAIGTTSFYDWAKAKLADRRFTISRRASLEKLTSTEKSYLIPYVIGQLNTVCHTISDGVVGGLEGKRIIYRSSSVGEYLEFPFNLQPWAREMLEADPSLLDGYSEREFATSVRRENAAGAIQELAEMGIRSDRMLSFEKQARVEHRRLANDTN